jgi:hypothetical protein
VAAGDDPLTLVRLDVAEMKGMLGQALSDHGQRITNLESDNIAIHGRLSDKGKTLARHDERINDLEQDNDARLGRILGTLGAVVGVLGLGFAVFNRFTL